MGMDVHGINPKQNKNMEDFPTYNKFANMDFDVKWKELDKSDKLKDKFFEEMNEYEASNPGVYFRNNCWWWRPLWNYCAEIAPDLIDDDLWNSGHCNDGAGLNGKDAKELGHRLLKEIANGNTIEYQASYQQFQEDKKDEDKFASMYPFDIDNVERFALFCIDSGGFEIY